MDKLKSKPNKNMFAGQMWPLGFPFVISGLRRQNDERVPCPRCGRHSSDEPQTEGASWTNRVDNSAAVHSNSGGPDEAPTQHAGSEQDSRTMANAVDTLGKTLKDQDETFPATRGNGGSKQKLC